MKIDFNKYLDEIGEIGFVEKSISSLVYASGLPGAGPEEVVVFESGELGQVTALSESSVEILSFSPNPIRVGSRIARTNNLLKVPVGEELLGHIINPLGSSINPQKPFFPLAEQRMVEVVPAGIKSRSVIKRQCETGISMIDLLLPIGMGQRELVMGDQKTGKSRVLMRTLLSQIKHGSVGIYAAVGKSQLAIKQIEETLAQFKILEKTIMVVSRADDAAGMIFLTPYTAMTIAEYFRDLGRDVLIVLDDLTVHAKTAREIALLGKRFPGRSSYPGDIFYTHARLLERAGNFIAGGREAAITCLPVVETVQGDMTGYIQTNIMSMTDGHLFFDHKLFAEGRRPAVDPFISVTRVGRQTQSVLQREISRELITFLRNAEKMHNFASFGAELGEHIKKTFEKEDRIMTFFDQTVYDRVPLKLQVFLFGLVWGEALADKTHLDVQKEIQKFVLLYESDSKTRERVDKFVDGSPSFESLLNRIAEMP